MVQAPRIGALVRAVAHALVLAMLAFRRRALASRLRARRAQDRMRHTALALVDGERADLGAQSDDGARGPAALLARYGRLLTAAARREIARFLEARGDVDRGISALGDRRRRRRATAARTLGT